MKIVKVTGGVLLSSKDLAMVQKVLMEEAHPGKAFAEIFQDYESYEGDTVKFRGCGEFVAYVEV